MRAAQGLTLSDDQIFSVINCLIRQNRLPYQADAVYILLGAQTTTNPGVQHL